MLKLEHVSKTFNLGTVNEKKALQDLNLTINDGDFITIIGGNGAGKSTTLNMIAGVYPIDCGYAWIKNKDFQLFDAHTDLEDECYAELSTIADTLLEKYRNEEIAKIRILYTRFVNSVTFEPVVVNILPVEKEASATATNEKALTEFEPAGDQILNDLVPMYVRSLLYSYFLETKTSEQASRRMAMESATDNAEELKETLELQFNQARQAAITQEITEIVGGVNAMEGANT